MTNFLLSLEQYPDLELSEHALVKTATVQQTHDENLDRI